MQQKGEYRGQTPLHSCTMADAMIMRLPDSGPWLSSALDAIGSTPGGSTDHGSVEDVTATQLNEALDALAHGDIEFVILEKGDHFVQVAGSDEGPYRLEPRSADTGDLAYVDGD